jgi:hypothetical protein
MTRKLSASIGTCPRTKILRKHPSHIAHIGKAPQANAETKTLPKSAIFANPQTEQRDNYILFFEIYLYISGK